MITQKVRDAAPRMSNNHTSMRNYKRDKDMPPYRLKFAYEHITRVFTLDAVNSILMRINRVIELN